MKQYEGKVRIFYKQFPLSFHIWAKQASVGSLCAYNQKPEAFWKFHDMVFASQGKINPQNVKEKMKEFAKSMELDVPKFEACLSDPKVAGQVDQEMEEGQSLGVTGTPMFFINGQKLGGAQPFESFKAVIESALKETAN